MSNFWKIVLGLLIVYGAWNQWRYRAVTVNIPGQIAPNTPIQEDLSSRSAPVFQVKNYTLTAQSKYHIQARLLRRENYSLGREAELSPVDFALGWGPMSANSLLDQMTITQSNRFYRYRWQEIDVPTRVVAHNSANTHLIPANQHIAKKIDAMRQGQVVELSGYLVDVSAPDGWRWNSSLTRTDGGAGACELLWVESAEIRQP